MIQMIELLMWKNVKKNCRRKFLNRFKLAIKPKEILVGYDKVLNDSVFIHKSDGRKRHRETWLTLKSDYQNPRESVEK